jgi:formate dehydrogenase major subunit
LHVQISWKEGKEGNKVKITRRDFLKLSGATTGFLLASPAFDLVKPPKALADMGAKLGVETTSICCCCACGCGMLITTENPGLPTAKVINVEGDPTHPVNLGGLCSKCIAAKQSVNDQSWPRRAELRDNYPRGSFIDEWPQDRRAARVLWRPKYGTQWKILTWNQALAKIGRRVNKYRQNFWETTADDGAGEMTVNRTKAIACLGGAAHDNQECYLLRKLMTGLGVVYVDHQARI